jgi:hypothetical protein
MHVWRPRHIIFRYSLNAPTKPQETLTNHEAEYFLQSQASLFWPIRTAATAYKMGAPQGGYSFKSQVRFLVRRFSYFIYACIAHEVEFGHTS